MRAMEPSPEMCPGCGQSVDMCGYEDPADCADARADHAADVATGAMDREEDE